MGLLEPSTWSWQGLAEVSYAVLDPYYGEGAPLEFVAKAVTPEEIVKPYAAAEETAAKILDIGDDWLAEAIAATGGVGLTYPTTFKTESADVPSIVRDLFTPFAESYVGWYEAGTPVERAIDLGLDIGSGIGQELEDVLTGTIEATAVPIAAAGQVLDPFAEAGGEFLEELIVPAAILGGAYLLLK